VIPTCPTGFIAFARKGCGYHQAALLKCHSPLCPDCERERAAKAHERWGDVLAKFAQPKFITLTISSGPNLKDRLKYLSRSFRRFLDYRMGKRGRKRLLKKAFEFIDSWSDDEPHLHKRSREEWKASVEKWLKMITNNEERLGHSFKFHKVLKGLASLEITYGDIGWHVHRHLIVDLPYLPWPILVVLWQHATKGQGKVVDIRPATNNSAGELLKYVCKSWEIPENLHQELLTALKGIKRLRVLGNLKPIIPPTPPCPHCGKADCHLEHVATVHNTEQTVTGTYLTEISETPALILFSKDEHGWTWTAFPCHGENGEGDLSSDLQGIKLRETGPPLTAD
jgi:hypothetical protein